MNKTIIVGNLGRDPEMRYLPAGTAVTSFPVAVNERYTNNSGEPVQSTVWYRASVFGKQAENCNQYLKKGSKVLIDGRLQADKETGGPRVYTDKQGAAKASFEITINHIEFLSPKAEQNEQQQPMTEDDMPF
jgi:single-strand DNA-binding protein